MQASDIKIRSFFGKAIRNHIPKVARLRMELFRDWPYLYSGDLEYETKYLKKFSQCDDAIFVIIYDGSTIIGASTGLPLDMENPVIQKPFLDHNKNLKQYFYCGELVLLKAYRGRGIGHHFFDYREEHARKLNRFKYACFASVIRPEADPRRPHDYFPLNDFWQKRGYVQHTEMTAYFPWKDIDDEIETEKPLTFWIKEL